MSFLKNKRILITGCCGTIGTELIRQLILHDVGEVIGLDNNESELFFLNQKYQENKNLKFYLCDIKNNNLLEKYFEGVNYVFHTAARKHVIINEIAPSECILTNIIGTQNIIDSALKHKVNKVIFTSSDKAVNPTNVMGTSKLMGERLITAADLSNRNDKPIFCSTRFGNVLGSNGSVIPIFINQILAGEDITLTDPEMSRFVMTSEEAVKLVIQSADLARGGEVFVTKMPVIKIETLAHAVIEIYKKKGIDNNTQIKIIGVKPGEKFYEELTNDEELRRTIEIENFFSVLPAFKGIFKEIDYDYSKNSKKINRVYRSDLEQSMDLDELISYLTENKLIV